MYSQSKERKAQEVNGFEEVILVLVCVWCFIFGGNMGFFEILMGTNYLLEKQQHEDERNKHYFDTLEKNTQIENMQAEINRLKLDSRPSGKPPEVVDLEEDVRKLEQERIQYEHLLSLPMREIAKKNYKFKETYFKQQQILTDFIVSQKAYKEIAMRYGSQMNKTPEEVEQDARQAHEDIQHDKSQFGNNLNEETKEMISALDARNDEWYKNKKEGYLYGIKLGERGLESWNEVAERRQLTEEDWKKISNIRKRLEKNRNDLADLERARSENPRPNPVNFI